MSTPSSPTLTKPLEQLRQAIAGLGHPDYPFNDAVYSPGSRVPCTDFTRFIIERLRNGDTDSVSQLMQEIIRANPGLGVTNSWMENKVSEILHFHFDQYLAFADETARLEMLATWIVLSKEGGGTEFWAGPDILATRILSWATCVNDLKPRGKIVELIETGNGWLRKMRRELEYWRSIDYFKEEDVNQLVPPARGIHAERFRKLSIGARLLLFYSMERQHEHSKTLNLGSHQPISLSTEYRLRSFGLNQPEVETELINSTLISRATDVSKTVSVLTKDEMMSIAANAGVPVKKSWKREKLAATLVENAQAISPCIPDDKRPFMLLAEATDEVSQMILYSRKLSKIYSILCFIELHNS